MLVDNIKYLELQEKYLINRSDVKTLGEMMVMIKHLTKNFVKTYCKKYKLYKSFEDVEDLQTEVVLRVLTRYSNNKEWKIYKNLSGSLYFDCLKCITQQQNKAAMQQRFEDNVIKLQDYLSR
jgi:hypothetical protein